MSAFADMPDPLGTQQRCAFCGVTVEREQVVSLYLNAGRARGKRKTTEWVFRRTLSGCEDCIARGVRGALVALGDDA
jgi:hypothetical protein